MRQPSILHTGRLSAAPHPPRLGICPPARTATCAAAGRLCRRRDNMLWAETPRPLLSLDPPIDLSRLDVGGAGAFAQASDHHAPRRGADWAREVARRQGASCQRWISRDGGSAGPPGTAHIGTGCRLRKRARLRVNSCAQGQSRGPRRVGVPERLTTRPGTAMSYMRTLRATISSRGGRGLPSVALQRMRLWASTAQHSQAPAVGRMSRVPWNLGGGPVMFKRLPPHPRMGV